MNYSDHLQACLRPLALKVRQILTFGLLGLALFTVGCGSSESRDLFCPKVVILREADRLSRFQGEGQDLTDVRFQAEIDAAITECKFEEDLIETSMMVRLRVGRGPADESRLADITYFVAIAKDDRQILARREFDVDVALPENQSLVEKMEEIDQVIPIEPSETGLEYFIFVGFALSPEELEYNRRNL